VAVGEIRIYADHILKKKTHSVKEVSPQTQKFIEDMSETMYENKDVGLATN